MTDKEQIKKLQARIKYLEAKCADLQEINYRYADIDRLNRTSNSKEARVLQKLCENYMEIADNAQNLQMRDQLYYLKNGKLTDEEIENPFSHDSFKDFNKEFEDIFGKE